MFPGSSHEKTCLESVREWEFTTSPPPSKIPHHNSSNSWIIFWKSWVIFWILIWTQAGEMASSLNFRFLLCNGGPILQCFFYLPLRVPHSETWNPLEACVMMKWDGTRSDPGLQSTLQLRIWGGHQRISHDGNISRVWICTICLHSSARGGEQGGSGHGAFSWGYGVGNVSV